MPRAADAHRGDQLRYGTMRYGPTSETLETAAKCASKMRTAPGLSHACRS
eukprot:COSAG03_NODE_19932_length_327_cov_1.131579_1_plen_49_part_10